MVLVVVNRWPEVAGGNLVLLRCISGIGLDNQPVQSAWVSSFRLYHNTIYPNFLWHVWRDGIIDGVQVGPHAESVSHYCSNWSPGFGEYGCSHKFWPATWRTQARNAFPAWRLRRPCLVFRVMNITDTNFIDTKARKTDIKLGLACRFFSVLQQRNGITAIGASGLSGFD